MDSNAIKQMARELGFALCGVTEATPTAYRQHVIDWLAAGYHGRMQYLAENLDVRLDPCRLLPGARSVICVADHIGATPRTSESAMLGATGSSSASVSADDSSTAGQAGSGTRRLGRIARYAQVDDYHKIIKSRLHEMADRLRESAHEHQFRVCVDTAPILEREYFMRAGLGWVGKHTLLIHPRIGSHLLIGEIVTTLALECDEPEPDHCGTCTRCIDACPTDCISPYSLDASRCISYLTIEHREAIEPEFFEPIGEWLYGCDICQDVCPYNARSTATKPSPQTLSHYSNRPTAMDVLAVLNWSEDDRRAAFTRSAMKRAKLHQIKRNALIVAGNLLQKHPDAALAARIRQIAADASEDPIVRDTAAAVAESVEERAANCR